jgi:hypothetical protein
MDGRAHAEAMVNAPCLVSAAWPTTLKPIARQVAIAASFKYFMEPSSYAFAIKRVTAIRFH